MVFSAFLLIDRRVSHPPAMPCAWIDLRLKIHSGLIQSGSQAVHRLQGHPVVGLGKTDMELDADFWRNMVRIVRRIGSQAVAVGKTRRRRCGPGNERPDQGSTSHFDRRVRRVKSDPVAIFNHENWPARRIQERWLDGHLARTPRKTMAADSRLDHVQCRFHS